MILMKMRAQFLVCKPQWLLDGYLITGLMDKGRANWHYLPVLVQNIWYCPTCSPESQPHAAPKAAWPEGWGKGLSPLCSALMERAGRLVGWSLRGNVCRRKWWILRQVAIRKWLVLSSKAQTQISLGSTGLVSHSDDQHHSSATENTL